MAHLAERQAVFGHADLLAATLAREPGAVTVDTAERAIAALERDGALHAARGLDYGRHWSTDAALARESETIALMRAGQGAEKTVMRRWVAETKLHRGRLNEGQKEAVKTVLAGKDRVVAVQGYAGTGKTTMLKRLRALGESRGYRTIGLAPSASAAKTLAERVRDSNPRPCNATSRAMTGLRTGAARRRGCASSAPPMPKRCWWWTSPRSPPARKSAISCASRRRCACPAWCWWATKSSSARSRPASPSSN